MESIKLEYNKESIIINKINKYQINSIEQWIFLTKFTKAYLVIDINNNNIETPIDKKVVYNQDYELINDLDFEYKNILSLGNTISFTGSFDGNNHIIKNIKFTNTNNNGLFGVVKSGVIKNLIIQNIIIIDGFYNSILVNKAYKTNITNIKIIGNIYINGDTCCCISNYYDGSMTNIYICVDGLIQANNRAIISNKLIGTIKNINIISNIKNSPSLINIINGRIKYCSFMSFSTIAKPFYEESKNHLINYSYYFQLNDDILNPIQKLYSCYYRNLNNTIIWSNELNILEINNWEKINNYYYLKNNINYSNESLDNYQNIQYYDLINEFNNIKNDIFIKKNQTFSSSEISTFNLNNNLIPINYLENDNIYFILNISNDKILEIIEQILEELKLIVL
jgi:hypothetical protein